MKRIEIVQFKQITLLFYIIDFENKSQNSHIQKLVKLVVSQQIILDKDFGQTSTCYTDMVSSFFNKFSQELYTCDSYCFQVEDNVQRIGLASDNRLYGLDLTLNYQIPQLVLPHTTVEVTAIFFDQDLDYITVDVDAKQYTTVFPYSIAQNPIYNYTVECNTNQKKFKKLSFEYKYYISTPNIIVKFIPHQINGSPNTPYFGLKAIKIQTNCCTNCFSCSTSTECDQCKPGYNLVYFGGSVKRCEQFESCPQGCSSCAYYSSQYICTSCRGGYTLSQATRTCLYNPDVGNICQPSQYFNEYGECESITTNCQLYDEILQTFVNCTGNEIPQMYRCPLNTFSLIFYKNEISYAKCGCVQKNCLKCTSTTVCLECNTQLGYYLTIDGFCDRQCAVGQTYDRIRDKCCESNCLECDSTNCLKCAQDNMYFDPSNLQQCLTTSDTNCQVVDQSSGNCTECKKIITNNLNSSCSCPIKHCNRCDLTNGNICTQCVPQYFLTSFNDCCGVENCFSCNSNNINQCVVCNNNYKLDQQLKCIFDCLVENCLTCVDANPSQCQTCVTNYKLDINGSCVFDCKASNCSTCIDDNPQQCSVCNTNYKLDLNNQCVLDCQVQNCSTCVQNNINQCEICNQNYSLDSNKNCIFSSCSVANCSKCINNNPLACETCLNNFKYNTNTQECICDIKNCEQCGQNFCDKCIEGYYYDNNLKECSLIRTANDNNDFEIKQKLEFDKYDIKVVFKNPVIIQQNESDYAHLMNINISNINESEYKYEINKLSEQQFQIIITPLANMKNSEITVKMNEQQFVEQNKLQKVQATEKLEPYAKISAEEKQQAEKATAAGQTVSDTVIYTLIPTIFMGNFYIVCNTLDITGFLYYYPFLNIRMPYNVVSFYGIFKDFSFPFIPNMFKGIIDPNYTQASPSKFMQFNTDNYFISNAGQSFTVVLSGFGLYILAKVLSYTPILYIGPYCKRAVNDTWEFGGLIDLAWSFYIYIIVGILMQLNTINFDDENSAFINYSFHAFCSLIYLGVPVMLAALIFKNKNLKDDKYIQAKLSSVLNGLNLYNETDQKSDKIKQRKLLSKYYSIVLYIRKIFFCAVIVWCHEYVYAQLALFTIMNSAVILFILMVTPFESKVENIKNFIQELILVIIQICCAFLVEDKENEEESDRISIGWVMVSLSGFIIAWYTFITLKDLLIGLFTLFKRMMIELYKSLKKLFTKQKDSPLESGYKIPEMNKLQNIIKSRKQSILVLNKFRESLLSSRKNSMCSSVLIDINRLNLKDSSPPTKHEISNNMIFDQENQNNA